MNDERRFLLGVRGFGAISLLVLLSSVGGAHAQSLPGDVSAVYEGRWNGTRGTAGDMAMTLVQAGDMVTGTYQVTATSCLGSGTLSGTRVGDSVDLMLDDAGTAALGNVRLLVLSSQLTGSWSISAGCREDEDLSAAVTLAPVAALPSPTATPTPTGSQTPPTTGATVTPTPTGTVLSTSTPTFARTQPLPTDDVTGPYRGTWASSTGAGAVTLTLNQTDQRVEGTAVFDGHPCLTVGLISGRVSGNVVTGTLRSGDTPATGNLRLTAIRTGLNGTYSLVSDCPEARNGTINVVNTVLGTPIRTPSSTPTATGTRTPSGPTPTATASATPSPTPGLVGDCNGDGIVTVDEVVSMVSIGLSTRPLDRCPFGDRNLDGLVTVDEILQGLFAALSGIDSTDTPPPLVDRCPNLRGSDCRCRGEVCCVAGLCAVGEPCDSAADCMLGLRCGDGALPVCVEDGSVVVPPPR